jgi:hypothetical protein
MAGMEQMGQMVRMDGMEHRVLLVLQDRQVPKGSQVHQVNQENQEQPAHLGRAVHLDQLRSQSCHD